MTMPQLGETVTEGTILSWAKQPGDSISEDEVLLEISTDKVDTEVPSPAAGIVHQILVAEGETVAVGTPLAVIGEPGEDVGTLPREDAVPTEMEAAPSGVEPTDQPSPAPEPVPVAAAAAPAPAETPTAGSGNGMRQVLSPVVRRLAAASGVDLALVPGTGAGGRITRKDVEAFLAAGGQAVQAAPAGAPVQPEVVAPPAPAAVAPPAPTGVEVPVGGSA
ncbi:MAG: dihydrolipoyllysine-residue succinyltransferase, partial [Akkermansiaceae bacterium]|nr:dihydrolipoyllysine-residue succinyltransferase [Akkermansiaceae bacterium]